MGKRKGYGRENQINYTLPYVVFNYLQTISQAEGMTMQKMSRRVIIDFVNDYIKNMQRGRK